MLGIARRLCRDLQDAEDVAQEVFLRLHRSLDRVDPGRPLEPWIGRIAANAALSRVARRPAPADPLTGDEPAVPRSGQMPDAGVDAGDVRRALAEAVATLPERERDVFVLREIQHLETRRIADGLSISEVTVRRHAMEARRRVEAWIREHRPELVPRAGLPKKTGPGIERSGGASGKTK